MSKNLDQIYITNPITTNASTDLMYFMQSPYTSGTDAGMTYANFASQFGSPFTPSAMTQGNDTNVTLTLGGTPATSLLKAVSITAGWTGTLAGTRGGTGVNNGASTMTIGGSFAMSGAFTFTGTVTGNTTVTFPTSGTLATTSQIPTGAALTETNDTNVTLTLGGSPTTALVNAASITAGWSGQLAVGRGGTGFASATAYAVLCGGTTTTGAFQSIASVGTSGQVLTSNGAGALPTFQAGGTGTVNSGTSGQLAYYASTGTAVSGLTTGTGVTTALGVNTGSAGAFVVNGGALGTPSSGTLTNATGLPLTTGITASFSNGGMVYSGASALAILAASGSANKPLLSGGAGTPAWSAGTLLLTGQLQTTGNFTTSGNQSLTLDLTGSTTVTLPTSGTLATNPATTYAVVCAGTTSSGPLQVVSGVGTTGQVLTSNGASALPTWQAATGSGTVNSGTANQLAYYASTGATVSGLTTANSSVLVTSSGGVPSLSTTLPAAITIPTPKMNQINDTNGNEVLLLTATSSAVNYLNVINSATGNAVQVAAAGSDPNLGLTFVSSGTGTIAFSTQNSASAFSFKTGTSAQHTTTLSFTNNSNSRFVSFPDATGTLLMTGVAISTVPSITFSSTSGVIGSTTNDSAAAGSVGEIMSNVVPSGSGVSATTATPFDICSISLTEGDWDIWGNITFNGSSNMLGGYVWINSSSATLPDSSLYAGASAVAGLDYSSFGYAAPGYRVSITTTTTYYLSGQVTFPTGSATGCGGLYARRRR